MKLRDTIMKLLKKHLNKWSQESIDEVFKELHESVSQHLQLLNKEKRLEWIPIRDILFTHREEGKFSIFTTRDGEYKHCIPHETVLDIFSPFNFQLVDNKVLVNLDQVTFFHSEMGQIYFDVEITKDSLHA